MSNIPSAPPSYTQATVYPNAPPEGGYPGPAMQEANPPYPTYSMPGGPQPAFKQQAPYPVGQQAPYPTGYPPQPQPQPQPVYYQGAPQAAGYNQPTSYGSPYQATAAASASPSYGHSGYHDDEQGIVGVAPTSDWAGSSFSDKKIRHTFIKKVYLILMSQLTITFAVVCFFMFYRPVRDWVQVNNWFYWCSYAIFLVTYITLVCCEGVRRRWPGNFICLAIFEQVYRMPICDITELWQRLIQTWAGFQQNIVDKAIDQWRKRLRACVRAQGGHFEQLL